MRCGAKYIYLDWIEDGLSLNKYAVIVVDYFVNVVRVKKIVPNKFQQNTFVSWVLNV